MHFNIIIISGTGFGRNPNILIYINVFLLGNISPYMVSYMRNRTDETSLRNVDGLWITSVGSVSNSIGMVLGGVLDHRFGHRVASGIACFVYW